MQQIKSINDNELVDLLASGAIGVLPTDTVYGIVCSAKNKEAVERIYNLKLKKHQNKPGTVIAANVDQLVDLGLVRRYLKAVEEFWPGPVSVIIPCSENLDYIDLSMRTLAVRIPADRAINELLLQTGPLLTTSANRTGKPVATSLEQAKAYFNDSVDFYVDGGDYANKKASRIIRIIDDAIDVIREG